MCRSARPSFRLFLLLIALLGLALIPPSSRAEMFVASGTGSDGSLSASADFTFGAGTLTVTLTNTLLNSVIRSNGQGLSDFSFTLSNAPGALGSTSASGQFGNIDGNGKVTYASSDSRTGDTSPVRWLGVGGGSFGINATTRTISLEAIGGGKPSQMIAPYLANGSSYTNANKGLRQMSSWLIGPATFTLHLSGVTAATTVTAATFSFGTGPDTKLTGSLVPPSHPTGVPDAAVPAPPSFVLLGCGSVGLAVMLVRPRRRRAV